MTPVMVLLVSADKADPVEAITDIMGPVAVDIEVG